MTALTIDVPALCLVVLIGPSGAGKSTFARSHFKTTEVLSSDVCRGLVSDDENDQAATKDAFDVLYFIAAKRLAAGLLTVVDATNVRSDDRKHLVTLAKQHHVLPVAIVFDLPEALYHERNQTRPDRQFGAHVIRGQVQALHRSMRGLEREGFRHVTVLKRVDDVARAVVQRTRLWNDKRHDQGPFDLIGDVHGCLSELKTLLDKLGYAIGGTREAPQVQAPPGRRALFLGDLVDRGPDSPGVLYLVMAMVEQGSALCVPGNHDIKLMRKLAGRQVSLTHGIAETLEQIESEPAEFKIQAREFIDGLVSHFVLDEGKLVVAHAGLKESLQGRTSGAVREFALYGETTGETDEYGLPVRYQWANDYRGKAMVVYGHTPVLHAEWINRTICIDTGCVFGGELTALRYPEREIIAVPAEKVHYAPIKPLAALTQLRAGLTLDIDDVLGKRSVETRFGRRITVQEENARAALEVMSRFAVDPRWLVYLPPTMSPPATAPEGDLLERPEEAFGYFRGQGVRELVCQEKHMGSRAVIVLCRDTHTASARFQIENDGRGVIVTRTGRRFFKDRTVENALLDRLDEAMTAAGLWARLQSEWIVLDAELLPWSAKAEELLRLQYAPTGAAGAAALGAANALLTQALERGVDIADLAAKYATRGQLVGLYIDAYHRYCWTVNNPGDLKIAPFHVLAIEGQVGLAKSHRWQLDVLDALCAVNPIGLVATDRRWVELGDPSSEREASDWWHSITEKSAEGMVVKPVESVVRDRKGLLLQPAIKCRGREYLRIIYGPTYTEPAQLEALRVRAVSGKRSLAAREFALGLEALHRFVDREPLYRVHECVFGVLALESEPIDPRL